jgi:NitT/TauT family transport system ATP-binding protein
MQNSASTDLRDAPSTTKVGSSILFDKIERHFGEFHALGPITIDVKPGEFVSIIGPSGCGKSTSMLIAAGLLEKSSGSLKINGKELSGPQTDIGIVFQDHLLLEFRKAMSNVMIQQEIRHLPKQETREYAEELFGQLGLKGAEDRYPNQLSGGMRQRVAIARALVHKPSVLFMDEPFGALDAITRTQIRHDLEKLWLDRGMTVLFITHSVDEAIGLSDRVLVMSKNPGQIIEEIPIDLPRPRPFHLGDYPDFAEYAHRIYTIFEKLGIYNFK